MEKTTKQINKGLKNLSKILPENRFKRVPYGKVRGINRLLFYNDSILNYNSDFMQDNVSEYTIIRPVLLEYYKLKQDEKSETLQYLSLVNYFIDVLLKDINPLQFAESLQAINSINLACDVGQISSTTVFKYKGLLKLIPQFKEGVKKGVISVSVGYELSRLTPTMQYNVYQLFLTNDIDLSLRKVNYREVLIPAYNYYLNQRGVPYKSTTFLWEGLNIK